MERREALLAAIDHGRKLGDELAGRLTADERAEHGTYETWAPKDVFAHVAEWLARDLERLEITDGPLPVFGDDDLETVNQVVFAEHAEKSWDEVTRFFADTFDATRRRVEEMNAEELERDRELTDGSTRTAWRMIASHALMHLSPHIAIVYHRRNDPEMAAELEELTARVLLDLDDSPEWVGTAKYNLACHHALNGDPKRAIALLREALAKNPKLVDWSRRDSDLDGIRDDADFETVYAGT
jgi:hypothetical protein